ncbi:L-type lectin-domain containing receptor kinase IX.1 [Vitis vinifera]|uniref:L-type lectin-domain containing receptor kinase IX.1 n=1 Tax=Vitis vinifera TaxID=29760 RepID=A0A438FSF9_VITVI|nr:L-type lectin-domain containing receptor kinase IX.1 [Vitis vinifera]
MLGGTLGLANEKNETNKSAVTFIAVEFDTFTNAAKKDPEVSTLVMDSTNTTQSLSYEVDLREYLPEYNLERERRQTCGGIECLAFVVVGGFGLAWFYFWRKRNTGRDQEDGGDSDLDMDEDFEKGTGPRKFSFNELALATTNFSEGEKLGEGGLGGVYRGFLRELNSYVAVKRVTRNSQQGMKEYASEVKIFCRLRHRNLVQLMGWCHKKEELLLVYELLPNGSLSTCLFEEKTLLTWAMRYRIALGLASSLLYLHEESYKKKPFINSFSPSR